MTPHLAFAMREASQVGEARRHVARLSADEGFDEVVAGRLAIIATELGNNLVRHATGGRLLVAVRRDEAAVEIELLSLDDGPGMADVERCLRDGFSTGGTPGSGLGAVRRLASVFDIFSQHGGGTVVLARVRASADAASPVAFEIGGVCLPAPGESVSGDGWACAVQGPRCAVMVADGLGHGPVAAEASDEALAVFAQHAFAGAAELLPRTHLALRSTRGAAVAVLEADAGAGTLAFCGAGNVVGRLITGTTDRSMLTQHGTVGVQVRRPQPMRYDWPGHGIVVLHSDGLASRWSLAEVPALLRCEPALICAWLVQRHSRGRDDVTVVVLRRAGTP